MDKAIAPIPQELIKVLWDELADFPASRTDDALVYLMETLCGWLKADNAMWIGSVRVAHGSKGQPDLQHGWRGRILRPLNPLTPQRSQLSRQAMQEQDTDPGMTTCAITAEAGRFRVYRLRDGFLDFSELKKTRHYQTFYANAGISDRIWVVSPVNADVESLLVFDLQRRRRRFSSADADLAGLVLHGLKWFHQRVMLSHGVTVAESGFTPAQRRVLALLLTDMTEPEIAAKLGLTQGTVHQYAVALYRKLGVRGRAGLMAVWLGH